MSRQNAKLSDLVRRLSEDVDEIEQLQTQSFQLRERMQKLENEIKNVAEDQRNLMDKQERIIRKSNLTQLKMVRGLLNEGPEKLFENDTDAGRLKCCLGCNVIISSVEERLMRMTTTNVNAKIINTVEEKMKQRTVNDKKPKYENETGSTLCGSTDNEVDNDVLEITIPNNGLTSQNSNSEDNENELLEEGSMPSLEHSEDENDKVKDGKQLGQLSRKRDNGGIPRFNQGNHMPNRRMNLPAGIVVQTNLMRALEPCMYDVAGCGLSHILEKNGLPGQGLICEVSKNRRTNQTVELLNVGFIKDYSHRIRAELDRVRLSRFSMFLTEITSCELTVKSAFVESLFNCDEYYVAFIKTNKNVHIKYDPDTELEINISNKNDILALILPKKVLNNRKIFVRSTMLTDVRICLDKVAREKLDYSFVYNPEMLNFREKQNLNVIFELGIQRARGRISK